jgi:transcription elongation factor SPT4
VREIILIHHATCHRFAMSDTVVPGQLKHLRACLLCKLVKSFEQFRDAGCDNCERFVAMQGSVERVQDCTTNAFSGLVGMMDPRHSWVASWQRQPDAVPGLYALRVHGRLPDDVVEHLERLVVHQ